MCCIWYDCVYVSKRGIYVSIGMTVWLYVGMCVSIVLSMCVVYRNECPYVDRTLVFIYV